MRPKESLAAVCVAAFAALASADVNGPLTNDDILCLTMAGVGEAAIIAMIESSETDFDTGVDGVARLALAGVDDKVVARMVKASASRVTSAGTARCNVGSSRASAVPGRVFCDPLGDGGEGPGYGRCPGGRFPHGLRVER